MQRSFRLFEPTDSRLLGFATGYNLGKFLSIALQLGLLALVIYNFNLENSAFTREIMPLVLGGFVLHHFLPLRYRLPFFLALSLSGIVLVFGTLNGLWMIGLGLLLIAMCHLPIPFGYRVVALLVVGGGLAVLRTEAVSSPWSNVIWPILGSIFMFRLIVYMYTLRHQKEPMNAWRSLAYFFLLPNPVFPLFPVVDYNTFRRTYYDSERYQIYQKGITTLFWGVVHLVAYRFVNYYLTLSPPEVETISDLTRYVITNFLLYLRVSGQFHIIVGILHLFGFNLPPTHHLYYLASSFTDFWRRINIYWKDFMLTIFYYPAYFRLRSMGNLSATIVATSIVFFFTWFLHAYQWFWLRGSFLLAWHDVLFWVILGVLVIINVVYETRHGRKRMLGERSLSFREILSLTLKRVATFTTICILWSFWGSASVGEWLSLVSVREGTLANPASILHALLMMVAVVVVIFAATYVYGKAEEKSVKPPPVFFRAAALSGAMIVALFIFSSGSLDPLFRGQSYTVVNEIREARLGRRDVQLLERGYYEDLIGVNRFNSELWLLYNKQQWPSFRSNEAAVFTDDLLLIEIRPSFETSFKNAPLSTNQWGMRDKEYAKVPPEGTYRVALLGASRTMGSGVNDNETFETLLETRLNEEANADDEVQILNFSVPGYTPVQKLMALQTKALDFEPDAVFYIADANEVERTVNHLVERVRSGADLSYDYLREVTAEANLGENTVPAIGERQLKPFGEEIIAWAYREIIATAEERGMPAVWIYLPRIGYPEDNSALSRMAEEAGFTVIDLSDVYDAYPSESLVLAEWDTHPNVKGHQLVAEQLYDALMKTDLAATLTGRSP